MTDVSQRQSTRTAGDSWGITESVGSTALGVAACRAIETAREHPLIRDEFAQILVSSAGNSWAQMTELGLGWFEAGSEGDLARREFESACDYQAARTHFFDEFYTTASAAGLRQIVILASGLDSRAYRLDWPAGTTVYEIDQPQVLSYKADVLANHGATPTATHRTVGVDLRDDWATALAAAGFDRAQPTAWLAEGLLPYLPADAQDRLFGTITSISAPGSRIAVEAFVFQTTNESSDRRDARRQRHALFRERTGMESSVDVESLIYSEADREDAIAVLRRNGWQTTSVHSNDQMARLGRPVAADLAAESVVSDLISAQLPDLKERELL